MTDYKISVIKPNIIKPIYLRFPLGSSSCSLNVDIPFPVKKLRYISSVWTSTDVDFDGFGITYITANLKDNDNFLCMLETSRPTLNNSFEYIYPSPATIKGNHTFNICRIDGVPFLPIQNLGVLILLEFLQE